MDEAKHRKFVWRLVWILLADLISFCFFETWSAPLCILIIEILLIDALAAKYKISGTPEFINKLIKIALDKITSITNPK